MSDPLLPVRSLGSVRKWDGGTGEEEVPDYMSVNRELSEFLETIVMNKVTKITLINVVF